MSFISKNWNNIWLAQFNELKFDTWVLKSPSANVGLS